MDENTPAPRMQTIENATRAGGRPGDHITWEQTRVRDGLTITTRSEGIAHHRNSYGDWESAEGGWITDGEGPGIAITIRRPATPPAVEVELPGEHPAHITDVVETEGGDHTAYAALDVDGDWCGVGQDGYLNTLRPTHIAAFTLPDGTRARRDGEHADGRPRFIKVREGEK